MVFKPSRVRAAGLAVFWLAATGVANAQNLKPGLWEHGFTMKSASGEIEKGMAQAQAELARLPPDQRKMMEQMMAQQGVGMTGKASSVRLCITPEQASRTELPAGDGKCEQKSLQRSGSTIRTSFVCAGPPPTSGQSEITLKGDTAYSGRSVVDTTVKGKPERMTMDVTGKWLSADCGNVKPLKR
jgi:hypothetical protein